MTGRTTIDMTGTAKTVLREKLTSNAKIAFSGEFNPFFDQYKFGWVRFCVPHT